MPGRRIKLGGREVTVAKKRPGDGDVCRHTRYPDAVTLWSRSKFLLEEATAVALLLGGRKNNGAARKSVACFQNTGHKTLAIPLKNQQTREINAARACLVACGVPDLTALPPAREVLSLTETPSLKQRAAAAIGGGTNFRRRGGCTPWYNRCALTNTGDGFSALLEARSTQSQIPISSRWLRAPTIAQSPCCQPVLCNSVDL